MDRRDMINTAIAAGAVATFAGAASLPKRDGVRVAFRLGEWADRSDAAGPGGGVQDAEAGGRSTTRHPFERYAVGATLDPVTMTGGFKALPHYSVTDAPQPHVIVIPAHRTHEALQAWLKKASAEAHV